MFLSSITNGIIQVWRRPINPSIMKQFLDVISKIPLEMSWIAEGKTPLNGYSGEDEDNANLEAWMIKRVSQTNFFIAGRAIAKTDEMKDGCSQKITSIFEKISDLVENSLEKEWIRIAKYH